MTREEKINTLKAIIQECEKYQWQRKETLFEIIKDLEQEHVYYPPCIDCNKKMDEIRKAYDNMTTKAPEQEPFINKPCVSSGVCEHDKQKVLDKIRERVELEKRGYPPSAGYYKAIMKVLQIIDEYKAESNKA